MFLIRCIPVKNKQQKSTNTVALREAATRINSVEQQYEKYYGTLPSENRMKLMGLEGSMAQIYWRALGNNLPADLRFEKRSRMPATDVFNAALNYAYALLQHRVEAAILSCRLDPFAGMLHVSDYGNKALVFDLMEPFRPIIDRCLIQMALSQSLTSQMADPVKDGVMLNKKGKRLVIEQVNTLMEQRIKWQHHITATKNHLLQFAANLSKQILLKP